MRRREDRREEGSSSFPLHSLIGREKENKEKQQRKRNFSSPPSSFFRAGEERERAKISGSFCSLRANPCSGRRGVTFTPPSLSLSQRPSERAGDGRRPTAAERWAAAAADAATAAATDALLGRPSIPVRYPKSRLHSEVHFIARTYPFFGTLGYRLQEWH